MTKKHIPYFFEKNCDIADFARTCEQNTTAQDAPSAAEISKNIPIYDMASLPITPELMGEWAQILGQGAGVIALRNACPDLAAIDEATAVFETIIAEEKKNGGAGDHFAKSGANDRIWNSLEKLALAAPATFARYFASPAIDAAARAWLGPNYQMTAQLNLVRPGGAAQAAHRDYHLGFQTAAQAARFPAHVHDMSAALTLQGGIAHVDMPIESGTTKLLPFSQNYRAGYVAYRRADFSAYFEANYVQLALQKGDCVFFNPALFHAAGDNKSADVQRMVNLLQVSSAFGRAMESVDRVAMCRAVYPVLLGGLAGDLEGGLEGDALDAVIAACAEGYSFPTDLDKNPPKGGLAPESQAEFMHRALAANMTVEQFGKALLATAGKR